MSETQNIFKKKMSIITIEEKGIITTDKKTFERIMMAITVIEEMVEITTDRIEDMIEDMMIENMIVDIEGINLIIRGMKEIKGKNEEKILPHLHKSNQVKRKANKS